MIPAVGTDTRAAPLGDQPRSRVAGGAVWLLIVPVVAVFTAGLVAGIVQGASATPIVLLGWPTDVVLPILAGWGLPAGSVVAYVLLLELVLFAFGMGAAVLLLRPPLSGFRVYVAVVVILHTTVGGTAPLLLASAVPSMSWVQALTGLGWFGIFSLLLVFPDGRFVPRWMRWTIPAWVAVFVAFLTLDSGASQPAWAVFALLSLLASGAAAQLYRYRRVSDAETRRRARWVLAALVARAGLVTFTGLIGLVRPGDGRTAPALAIDLALNGASYLVSALFALALAVVVVRHRLFESDVVVSRAVVYGTLTVFVLLVYGLIVGGVGAVWTGGGVLLPVLATAVAAAELLPARSWLQRRVARLVYGDRAEPYRVAHELGERLAATVRPEELVHTVVDVIGPTLGLSRAAITLTGRPTPIARYVGDAPPGATSSFPIDHRGRRVGVFEVAARRGEQLSAADRELLAGVAGQAGLAVAAARASAELRVAREQAVSAREEERRRMHRDLHDGLGPTLASIYQRVELAGRLIESDPDASRRLLTDTGSQVRETVGEVRRLVYALRPPRLDDLGLADAVRAACGELSGGRPTIVVRCPQPLPELPAATEITAYRIVLEAVTNAVRHAQATTCTVDLLVSSTSPAADEPDPAERALTVVVSDDGRGMPDAVVAGAGIRSLTERAAEVGGHMAIGATDPRGTTVTARLPLPVPLSPESETATPPGDSAELP